MAKVLILFAHPAFEKSRIHKRLNLHVRNLEGVTFRDLYETYPDLDIDVKQEQKLLLEHDVIIFQHPFYWYSSPAMIKQWQDLVLEYGWAYGTDGNALMGKRIFNAISCGGPRHVYSSEGRNRFSIPQFLAPFDQTAMLCKMKYLPPFVVHGTHRLSSEDIELHAVQYEQLLIALVHERISENECNDVEYVNDLIPIPQPIQS
ncbi:MAG: NAD(P)H oxidoreductase [Chitinophagaceae bacterium]|nr:MAG: NAD(P)H oxidoreductase [Chitinophagaceae bacterium]